MSTNLLELLNAHLTEDVVSKISSFIGESPKNTGSALASAVPSLLSGLMNKSSDSQGASILYNLLTQNHDSGLLSNLGASLIGGDVTAKLATAGTGLLNSIFGNKSDGIANVVASASGINKGASSSLLGLLMPIVFAVLGRTLKSQQITTPAGLVSLLGDQGGFLKNLVPSGLAGILGTGAAAAVASAASSNQGATVSSSSSTRFEDDNRRKTETSHTVHTVKETKTEPYVAPIVREHKIAPPPPVEDDDDAGIFGKLLPWLILGSILALGWGIWKNLNKTGDAVPPVAVSESSTATDTTATPPAVPAEPDATAQAPVTPEPAAPAPDTTAAAPVAGEFAQKLSNGFELKAAADSMESKLYAFINDAAATIDKDKWFTMDGILFDTGKATIRPESDKQIKNITEILKAFPAVKIKVGGYTDNTGNAKSNQKLSANRADAVKAAITKAGIDVGRLAAEGYGSEHPVATNDTAEGRQKNRRIDVNVTAK